MQLNSKDNELIRARYIKKTIINEIGKIGLTQEQVSERVGININTLKQYIWGPRAKTDDEYYDLIFKEVLGFDDEKIKKVKMKAREEQVKAEFGGDFMTSLSIEDNGQEPITTQEQAEKVLFKISGIKPTDEAIRSVRFALDLVKQQQGK